MCVCVCEQPQAGPSPLRRPNLRACVCEHTCLCVCEKPQAVFDPLWGERVRMCVCVCACVCMCARMCEQALAPMLRACTHTLRAVTYI